MSTTPDMVTIAEVSRMCRCSEFTIRRLLSLGDFPEPERLGGKLLWRREDVLKRLGYATEPETETIETEVDNNANVTGTTEQEDCRRSETTTA